MATATTQRKFFIKCFLKMVTSNINCNIRDILMSSHIIIQVFTGSKFIYVAINLWDVLISNKILVSIYIWAILQRGLILFGLYTVQIIFLIPIVKGLQTKWTNCMGFWKPQNLSFTTTMQLCSRYVPISYYIIIGVDWQ